MLLLPEVGEQRREPAAGQTGKFVDAGMAAGAEGDQMGGLLAAGAAMVDVGPKRGRTTGGAAAPIAEQDGEAQAAEAAAGVGLVLAAAGAE